MFLLLAFTRLDCDRHGDDGSQQDSVELVEANPHTLEARLREIESRGKELSPAWQETNWDAGTESAVR